MNYGLYLSASGILTSMYRMDVLSNNLANSETAGFKPVMAGARQRDTAKVEDHLTLPSDRLLEKLGGGVLLTPNQLSMEQGATELTGRPFDIALQGEGFLVLGSGGATGADVKLTRDGRLAINAQGQLVQAATGAPVLDRGDRPITLKGDQDLVIGPDGVVSQGGAPVAQLQIAKVADPSKLRAAGQGAITGPKAMLAGRSPGPATVVQKSIERSAVDPIQTMVDIAAAERAVGSNARMIQTQDSLLDRAINVFGKLA